MSSLSSSPIRSSTIRSSTIRWAAVRWAAVRWAAIRWAALAALIVPATAWARMPPSAAPSSLEISVLTPGGWMVLSDSAFTKKVSTLSLEIPGDVAARGARVRVRLRGHAAAHLDALLLDAAPPVEVKGAPLEKLAALDHDLADARAGVIEARFSSARGERPRLYVSGRIEPPEIGQLPFLFPPENTLGPMTAGSRFYTYRVGARGGRLTIDGALTAERLGEPFFKEVTRPTSGHPDGVAYGWVMNDAETLYVALDFLSDNTADGEADYAKVYLERDGALREYRVTVSERRWGRAGFVYTPRARHQHKAYELAIPLATVTDQHHDGAPIRIAFALYGTATSGMNGSAPIAFDPTSRRYALTYWEGVNGYQLHARLYDPLAATVGTAVPIENDPGSQPFGSVTADPIHGRFLASWSSSNIPGIFARLILPTGATGATTATVTDTAADFHVSTRMAFDPVRRRYFVAWTERTTGLADQGRARFLDADGRTTLGPSIPLGATTDFTAVTYAPGADELGVLSYRQPDSRLIRLRASDGGHVATSTLSFSQGYASDLAFDARRQRYLVVGREGPDARSFVVERDGTVTSSAVLFSAEFLDHAAVAFDPILDLYAVVGNDYQDHSVTGRFLEGAAAQPIGVAFPLNDSGATFNWAAVAADTVLHRFVMGNYDESQGTGGERAVMLPGICVDTATVTTREAGSPATVTVRLCRVPTGDVTVAVSSSTTSEATASPSTLTFTPVTYDQPQSVTITPADDSTTDGPRSYAIRLAVTSELGDGEYRDLRQVVLGTNLDDETAMGCGDGVIGTGEACDDGNTTSGDGCSMSCALEAGWICTGQPSACARIPDADAGAPDLGVSAADSGASGRDGGARSDATPASDAGNEEDESGCSCRTSRARTSGGELLLFALMLGVGVMRRRPSASTSASRRP